MNPAQLVQALRDALTAAVDAGELGVAVPADITLDRPRSREHGDYATPVAMKLAKSAGRPPREIAAVISARLTGTPGIEGVEIAGPGFLNIRLETAAAGALVGADRRGRAGLRRRPTRWPARGSTWSSSRPTRPGRCTSAARAGPRSATRSAGCSARRAREVVREYYFNDAGAQIDRFARSLLAAARGLPAPADGYGGDYIADIAGRITAALPDAAGLPDDEAAETLPARRAST